jgi:hypothetical protein
MVYNAIRLCVEKCYPNYYANLSRFCVDASSCPSSPVAYFGDDSTGKCVTGKGLVIQLAHSHRELTRKILRESVYFTAHLDLSQTQQLKPVFRLVFTLIKNAP